MWTIPHSRCHISVAVYPQTQPNLEHYLSALRLLGRSLKLQHAYQTGATSRTTDVLATMAARYMQTHNTDSEHTHVYQGWAEAQKEYGDHSLPIT
jgi:hypothetical protein